MKATKDLKTAVSAFGSDLDKTTKIKTDTDALFSDYSLIQTMGTTYRNMKEVKSFYNGFQRIDPFLDRTEALLKDMETNILLATFYITILEEFNCYCRKKETNTTETNLAIDRKFERLGAITQKYTELCWQMARNILLYAEQKKTYLIVWIAKVVQKRNKIQEFADTIERDVEKKLKTEKDVMLPAQLQAASIYKTDLSLVKTNVSKCFPETMHVTRLYINAYHKNIYHIFEDIEVSKTTAPDIIVVLGWTAEYYGYIHTEFNIKRNMLVPDLLKDKETALQQRYVALCSDKISSWFLTLANTEVKTFTERISPPERDENNLYFSPTGMDLFEIIKQQAEAVKKAQNSELTNKIVFQCISSIFLFQEQLQKGIECEKQKYIDSILKNKETTPYTEEYMLMLGNTSLKWIGFLSTTEETTTKDATQKEKAVFAKCDDGFVAIAKKTTDTLVAGIQATLDPVFATLYNEQWCSRGSAGVVVATLSDFLADYKDGYCSYLYFNLVSSEAHVLLQKYILLLKKNIDTIPKALEAKYQTQFSKEIEMLCNFFMSRLKDTKNIQNTKNILLEFNSLLFSSTKESFLFQLRKFYSVCGDANPDFISSLIDKRETLDKTDIIKGIEEIKKDIQKGTYATQTTSIFHRLG